MTPPNFFRFIAKTLRDTGPTEENPNYVTFNKQFYHRPSSGYTYNISNFTIGDDGAFTGDLHYHSSTSYRRTYFLEANGASNSYDIRSGSIIWEMQPDAENGKQSATSELDDQGWDTRVEWQYRPKRLSDDSFFTKYIQYDPSNYNSSPAYYERWSLYPNGTSAGWGSMNFEVSNAMKYKPSDFQFRWMLTYSNAGQTAVKLRVMHRHTASVVSWDDLMSTTAYDSNEYFGRDAGSVSMTFDSEDSYKFYPSFKMHADANPGSGVDVAVKYFKVWYGEHHNS